MKKILVILTVIASFVLCSCEPPTVNVPSNIPSNNIPSGNNENNPNNEPNGNEPNTPSNPNGENNGNNNSSSSNLTISECCEILKQTENYKLYDVVSVEDKGAYIHIVFNSEIPGDFYKYIEKSFNEELTEFKIVVRRVHGMDVDYFNTANRFTNIDVTVEFN